MSTLVRREDSAEELYLALFDSEYQECYIQVQDGELFINRILFQLISKYKMDSSTDLVILPDITQASLRALLNGLKNENLFKQQATGQHMYWLDEDRLGWNVSSQSDEESAQVLQSKPNDTNLRGSVPSDNVAWQIIQKNISVQMNVEQQSEESGVLQVSTAAEQKDASPVEVLVEVQHDPGEGEESDPDGGTLDPLTEPIQQDELEDEEEDNQPVEPGGGEEPQHTPDGGEEFEGFVGDALDAPDHNNDVDTEMCSVVDSILSSGSIKFPSAEKKSSQCSQCGKILADSCSLKRHEVTIHSRMKNFPCTQCDQKFAIKAYLKEHINTVHTEKKMWVCDLCGERLRSKKGMQTHLLIHQEGSKNLQCPDCPKLFRHKNTLTKHVKRVHEFNASEKLKCDVCTKLFNHTEGLKRHVKKMHGQEKRFACDQCSAAFAFNYDLNKHKKKHHPLRDNVEKSRSEREQRSLSTGRAAEMTGVPTVDPIHVPAEAAVHSVVEKQGRVPPTEDAILASAADINSVQADNAIRIYRVLSSTAEGNFVVTSETFDTIDAELRPA